MPVGQRYTARQPGDPLNTMTYKDGVIVDGISAAGGSRWEDWSNLAQDPTDDCTFWYYGGYGDSSRTGGPFFGRTGAFRVPTCRLDATPAPAANITGRYDGPVASFTNSDLTGDGDSFIADIDWGDGTHSPGTVTGGNGTFAVAGDATTTPRRAATRSRRRSPASTAASPRRSSRSRTCPRPPRGPSAAPCPRRSR